MSVQVVNAAEVTGEAIYTQQCVRCHSPSGGGTKKAALPLIGDKSLPQLARVIQRTMPESDPGSLSQADAAKVAEYVYKGFYSPDAQAKANPPRVDLARLTVRQYRNSVADLIGSFRQPIKPDDRRGLRGEYFASRDFRTDRRLIDRIDPELNFDFHADGPAEAAPQDVRASKDDGKSKSGTAAKGAPESKAAAGQDDGKSKDGFNPQQFCARWEGSVTAPETGPYDFVVRSDQAVRLFVNDLRTPLIDAMIKSGSDTEFRGTIFLLAGRSYSLRLEFSKGRQLTPENLRKHLPPVPASVALLWKAPHRPEEIIPSRHLSAGRSAEVAVIETPFPPDDRSYGWERGTTISKEWFAATTGGALEAAGYIAARLPELSGVQDNASDRAIKLRAFSKTFAERAFRRPLTDAEKKRYVDSQFDAEPNDPQLAVKRSVLLVLKSARFLYPALSDMPPQYAAASKLSYTLWDSSPDKLLMDAAAAGKLGTRDELRRHAERMLADPRARTKVREFMFAWLHVDHSPEVVKDAKRFPGFDAKLAADLRTSLELFLDDVVWSEASDFRQLMLSDQAYLNGRLAKFYGAGLPPDAGFQKTTFDPGHRSGVVTHPYLLSVLAYAGESSPIHRGVFLVRGILGVSLRPPNEAFVPLPPDKHPDLTTRQRVSLQTKGESCIGCHGVINPVGFALENFDAVGRHRERDASKPIDVTGEYETRAGPIAKFDGPKQLATYLAGSEDVHGAFAQQMFQHLVKQSVRAYGLQMPAELRKTFVQNGYSVKKLIVEIAATAAEKVVSSQ
ncbi:DUF1592 domain-containing protein [Humisphaera borealis]|uniref:DUF1592 domain-containing protein n=2 Tax=Humisphaera borealis TaxID=2807512 RepID=A0A7M2X3T1_9BACT|nr:DUF1592 domain-containing protein [Humisphaera borealis]